MHNTQKFRALKGSGSDIITLSDNITSTHALMTEISHLVQYQDENRAWAGESWNTCLAKCLTGDLGLVARSDEMISKLEDKVGFESRAFATVNDVVGGIPNIGAYLAGNPLSMRRRVRRQSEFAPLTIMVDLTSSGGVKFAHLENRGAAILALLRILSTARPISLFVGTALKCAGGNYASSALVTRVESSPLDIARSAHMLISTAYTRRLGYAFGSIQDHGAPNAHDLIWPYNDVEFYRSHGTEYWRRILGESDMLFVPPVFASDTLIVNPDQWLIDMVAKYGRQEV